MKRHSQPMNRHPETRNGGRDPLTRVQCRIVSSRGVSELFHYGKEYTERQRSSYQFLHRQVGGRHIRALFGTTSRIANVPGSWHAPPISAERKKNRSRRKVQGFLLRGEVQTPL